MRETTGDPRRARILAAVVAAVVVVAVVPDLRRGIENWDTQVKTVVAWNLVHGDPPTLTASPAPEYYDTRGSDGRIYGPYPFFAYVLQIPSALCGAWFGVGYEGLAPLALLALTGAFLLLTGLRAGASRGAAAAGALLACLGTALRPMVAVGHDNGIEVLALAVLLWAAAGPGRLRELAWAGLATGLAIAARLGAVPLLVPAALVVARAPRGRREVVRRAVAFSIGCLPGLAMIVGFNVYRFGSPFEVGIPEASVFVPWFSVEHGLGILGLTVSPGKGLLWYSPALVAVFLLAVPLTRRFPLLLGALGAYLLAAVVFYGRLTFWHGDWGWGPRYVAPFYLAVAPLAWWCWDGWASTTARRTALGLAAAALLAFQALPNAVNPVGLYLQAMQERAARQGAPAPRILAPVREDGGYFYFRTDTSPLVVLGELYAASFRQDAPPRVALLAPRIRRTLAWALVGVGLSAAACFLAARRRAAGPGSALPRPDPDPADGVPG